MKNFKTFFLILVFIFSLGFFSSAFAVEDEVTVGVSSADLYASPIVQPTSSLSATVGVLFTMSSTIYNSGTGGASNFPYFFHIAPNGADGGDGTGRIELPNGTISSLGAGASTNVSGSYTFTSAGTYSFQTVVDLTSRNPVGGGVVPEINDESSGTNNNWSWWTTIIVDPAPVPPVPTGLTATTGPCTNTPNTGMITVSWNASAGAVNYTVIADGSSMGNISQTSFVDSRGLALGSSHTYQVRANNSTGGSSAYASVTGTASNVCSYTYYFDGNGATVNPSPTSRTLGYGTSITPPTNPSLTGYNFAGWSPSIPATMPVNGGTSVAQWSVSDYYLTLYTGGTGSGNVWGEGSYTSGSTATAGQSAIAGSSFAGWSGDCNASGQVVMNSNKSCTAIFNAIPAYTLTYTAGTGGTISGTSPQSVMSGSNGTAVTAVPNTGYTFTGWSDGISTATRTDTNVTASKSVTASFSMNSYSLTINTSGTGGGTVGGAGNYNHGTVVTATASANLNSTFTGWSGDCNASGQVTMDGAKVCNARFTLKPVVSVSASPSSVDFGSSTNITLSATNNPSVCVVNLTNPNNNTSTIFADNYNSNPEIINTGNLSIQGSYLVTAMCYDTYYMGESNMASTAFSVLDELKAPTLSNPVANTITWYSAILGATITDKGNPASITDSGICFSPTISNPRKDGNINTTCVSAGATALGAFSKYVDTFQPDTNYYFNGYAINATDTGYSNSITFRTAVRPDPPTILSFKDRDNKEKINLGSDINLIWATEDALSCNIKTIPVPWQNLLANPTPAQARQLYPNTTTRYTLTCTGVTAPDAVKTFTIQVGDIKQVIEEY